MKLVPLSIREANAFTSAHHRHNCGTVGHKFSIGLEQGGVLIGVATVGRPVARKIDDGYTAEILRVCVYDELGVARNANSMLYGAACRACKAMGYRQVITYTLKSESGSSLKAAGFFYDGDTRLNTHGWDVPSRRRTTQQVSLMEKQRWRRIL